MKNYNIIYVLMFTAATASFSLAQTKGIDKYGEALFEGRPFITDSALYNSYDLGGSPLGLFEKGYSRFNARVGYRYSGLGDAAGQRLDVPVLVMGIPGRSFFEAFYSPAILSLENGGNEISLPLHRFGLVAASQDASGAMRGSFMASGYLGWQKWDGDKLERLIIGFEKLRFDMGSQVHPLVRIGFFVGVSGGLDKVDGTDERDRSGQVNLPEFGGSVDFGGEDAPVRSNAAFSYAFSRLLYTNDMNVHQPAVRNDSMDLFWVSRARVPVGGNGLVLQPGLLLGYTSNVGDLYGPNWDKGNNDLIALGDAVPNTSYGLSGFWFGVGTGFKAMEYADVHVEYAFAAMSLKVDSTYLSYRPEPAPSVYSIPGAIKNSRMLHHTSAGVSTKLNNYVEMPVTVVPRLSYFIAGTVNAVGAARLNVNPLNPTPTRETTSNSKYYTRRLYYPQELLDGFAHISGITIGVDASALEESVTASVWTTFLSSKPKDGYEIGVKLGFNTK